MPGEGGGEGDRDRARREATGASKTAARTMPTASATRSRSLKPLQGHSTGQRSTASPSSLIMPTTAESRHAAASL